MGAEDCVKVAVRVRPFNEHERKTENTPWLTCPTSRQISFRGGKKGSADSTKTFTYDHAFDERSTQTDIFEKVVVPILDDVLQGFNCTIFAYGQTGESVLGVVGDVLVTLFMFVLDFDCHRN